MLARDVLDALGLLRAGSMLGIGLRDALMTWLERNPPECAPLAAHSAFTACMTRLLPWSRLWVVNACALR